MRLIRRQICAHKNLDSVEQGAILSSLQNNHAIKCYFHIILEFFNDPYVTPFRVLIQLFYIFVTDLCFR